VLQVDRIPPPARDGGGAAPIKRVPHPYPRVHQGVHACHTRADCRAQHVSSQNHFLVRVVPLNVSSAEYASTTGSRNITVRTPLAPLLVKALTPEFRYLNSRRDHLHRHRAGQRVGLLWFQVAYTFRLAHAAGRHGYIKVSQERLCGRVHRAAGAGWLERVSPFPVDFCDPLLIFFFHAKMVHIYSYCDVRFSSSTACA
jgi:hypothetical protein